MNLFLEGVSGAGKSTLLRECLEPYKSELGGFSSQRLWQGDFASYAIQPASCFELETSFTTLTDNIFIHRSENNSFKNLDVFKTYGIELLNSFNHKLILLDEIGGIELLVPEFREKLYELIQGPCHCIGVLKLNEKAKYMQQKSGYSNELVTLNEELRELINSVPDSRVIYFERERCNDVRAEINKFLEDILCTTKQPTIHL